MQSAYLHFKHPNILSTFVVDFFSGVYHPQDSRDEKVSLLLFHLGFLWGDRPPPPKKKKVDRKIHPNWGFFIMSSVDITGL